MKLRLAAALFLIAAPARADDTPAAPSQEPPPDPQVAPAPVAPRPFEVPPPTAQGSHQFSASISPLHLLLPMFEVTAEFRVNPHVGVALIGGAGRVTGTGASMFTATAYEAGGQVNLYLGEFAGLNAGVEVLYVDLGDVDVDATATAAGLAAGPYLGYKWLTDVGFTVIAQLGAQFALAEAKSSTGTGEEQAVIPLLNLNLGWTF